MPLLSLRGVALHAIRQAGAAWRCDDVDLRSRSGRTGGRDRPVGRRQDDLAARARAGVAARRRRAAAVRWQTPWSLAAALQRLRGAAVPGAAGAAAAAAPARRHRGAGRPPAARRACWPACARCSIRAASRARACARWRASTWPTSCSSGSIGCRAANASASGWRARCSRSARRRLLLVDEPLSALDPTRAAQALDSLLAATRERRATLVARLHQVDVALAHFPRIVGLARRPHRVRPAGGAGHARRCCASCTRDREDELQRRRRARAGDATAACRARAAARRVPMSAARSLSDAGAAAIRARRDPAWRCAASSWPVRRRGAAVAAAGADRVQALAAVRRAQPASRRALRRRVLSAARSTPSSCAGGARDLAHRRHRHRRPDPGARRRGAADAAVHARLSVSALSGRMAALPFAAAAVRARRADRAAQRARAGLGAGVRARRRPRADGGRARDRAHLRRHAGQGLRRDPRKRRPASRRARCCATARRGCRRSSTALLPQNAAELVSYTVYRWECAIRSSVVLGFVGAGGLGQQLDTATKMFAGGEVATMLLIFMALVALRRPAAAPGCARSWVDADDEPPPCHRAARRRCSTRAAGLRRCAGSRARRRQLLVARPALARVLLGRGGGAMGRFVGEFWPPQLQAAFLGKVLRGHAGNPGDVGARHLAGRVLGLRWRCRRAASTPTTRRG